nr:Chain C, Retinoblastoma-binding protein 5 [Mus musculus]
EPKQTG